MSAYQKPSQKSPFWDSLYIIALTAAATVKDKNHCLEAGMNTFMSKPIKIKELAMALKTAQEETALKRLNSISHSPASG